MTLDEWLRLTKTNDPAFAELIGVSQQTVQRYRTGKSIPDRVVMPKIVEVTNGAVQANDFYAAALPGKRKTRAHNKPAAAD